MKKTKYLALTLVVAIMMMGAGYAYWSETLTIENTVNTGELDVIFVEPTNVVGEDTYQPNADATPDGHGMIVTYDNIYPGVANEFHFTLDNEGTIGAYVDDFAITSSDWTSWPNSITDVVLCDGYEVEGQTPVTFGSDTSLATALNLLNDGNGIFVEKDDTVKVTFDLRFDNNADEITLPEDGSFGFVMESNVYQFNGR